MTDVVEGSSGPVLITSSMGELVDNLGAGEAPVGMLFRRGLEGLGAGLIGLMDSSLRPLGPWNLSRVSATPIGVVASGSGTAYTVAGSPLTLGTSGTVQAWDISAGAPVGAPVAYTRSGTSVTLASSRTLAAGDLLVDVSRCELRLGTDWIPKGGGAWHFNGSGLKGVGGATAGGCSLPGILDLSTGDNTPLLDTAWLFDVTENTTTTAAYVALGIANNAEMLAPCLRYDGAVWRLSLAYNTPLSPAFFGSTASGDPGTSEGVRAWCRVSPATTDKASYHVGMVGGNLNAMAAIAQPDNTASAVLPLGPSGPPDAPKIELLAGAGQLDVLVREVTASLAA